MTWNDFWGIHTHKWGMWKETGRGAINEKSVYDIKDEWRQTGMWVNQERKCANCGKIELSNQKLSLIC